jgi:hypothetical protein
MKPSEGAINGPPGRGEGARNRPFSFRGELPWIVYTFLSGFGGVLCKKCIGSIHPWHESCLSGRHDKYTRLIEMAEVSLRGVKVWKNKELN